MPTSRLATVLGLAALVALQANAAIATFPLPSQEAQVQDLIQLPDGRLAVSGWTTDWEINPQTGQLTGSSVSRGFVRVIDPLRIAEKDVEIPVPGQGSVMPYRKGFVAWGRGAANFEVRYFEVGQSPRESVLHSSDGLDYLYLAAPPAGDSLYVAESLSRGGMRLLRFDNSGQLAWTRKYEFHTQGVTAVNDGVVFMRPGPEQNYQRSALLTKLGLDGEEAWSAPAASGVGGGATVRFHGQKVISVATAAADESIDLVNYDSGTGRQTSRSNFPGFAQLVGTADGLLLIHSYLYRPYIAMLGSDGSIRWWRRYTPTQAVGVAVSGLISHAGQLVLLTQSADESAPANNVALLQANGKELSDGLNDCTRRDPLPVLRAEKTLRARYAVELSLDYSLMVPRSQKSGCPHPTEDEYASAVSAIAAEFVGRAEPKSPWAELVHVRIMGSGPAARLTNYYMGMAGTDSAESQMAFEINSDNAKAFAKYLRETVLPHMARIQAARRRFTELTGQAYGAHAPRGEIPEPDEFFAQIEHATEVLETKVRAVGSSHSWPRHRVGAILYPTQFGDLPDRMKPLEVADQTLIELMQNAVGDGRR